MEKNTLLTLLITALSHDGRGIAKICDGDKQNYVIFVNGAVPGQTVRAKITEKKAKMLLAETVSVCHQEGVREALCSRQNQCGGCPIQILPRSRQLAYKENFFRETLRRIGHLTQEDIAKKIEKIAFDEEERFFRNKIEYAFGWDNACVLGFRKQKSHTVVAGTDCIVFDPRIEEIREYIQNFVQKVPALCANKKERYLRHLIVRKGIALEKNSEENFWLVLITGRSDAAEQKNIQKLGRMLLDRFNSLNCFIHEEQTQSNTRAFGDKRIFVLTRKRRDDFLNTALGIELCGKLFYLDPTCFFQIAPKAFSHIVDFAEQMLAYLPERKTLLDLYCGVGAPGLLFAHHFDTVYSLEAQALAVKYAQYNAKLFGATNYHCMHGASQTKIEALFAKIPNPSLILVDPPRDGLDRKTIEMLTQKKSPILYISCNPATLARDIARLAPYYTVCAIRPVDLFPHTMHLESCSLLLPRDTISTVLGSFQTKDTHA